MHANAGMATPWYKRARLSPPEEDAEFEVAVASRKRVRDAGDGGAKHARLGAFDTSALRGELASVAKRAPAYLARAEAKRARTEDPRNMRALEHVARLLFPTSALKPGGYQQNIGALHRFYIASGLADDKDMRARIELVLAYTGRLEGRLDQTGTGEVLMDDVQKFVGRTVDREWARLARYLASVRAQLGWDADYVWRVYEGGGEPGEVEDIVRGQMRLVALCLNRDVAELVNKSQLSG